MRFPRFTRETRLLIITMVVSGLVLLLLARLRFPDPPERVDVSAPPLERLAARASFEELATRVAQLEATIAPSLIVLRLSPADVPSRRLGDLLVSIDRASSDVRHVPALRIDATTALAVIPPHTRISGIVGPAQTSGLAAITAADPLRHLARVQVPEGPARALSSVALSSLRTPSSVVAVEGTQAGVTLRPIFLGRSDRFASPRWSRPLLPFGGTVVAAGALLFTLDGEFLGCAVMENGAAAIAGAADVLETVARIGSQPALADAGIAVQPLAAAVAAATGVSRGVVIADVSAGSSAAGVLEPGDVVTRIDQLDVSDPDTLLLELGTRLAAGGVEVTFVRGTAVGTARLQLDAGAETVGNEAVILQTVSGRGSRIVSLPRGSAFEAAGLSIDDVIVAAGAVKAPSPAQVRRLVADAAPGDHLLLVVRRGERQRVVAVQASRSRGASPQ
jgi:hypothetical protein